MKSRLDDSMVKTFKEVYAFLKQCNCSPKLNALDNECRRAVENFAQNKKQASNLWSYTTTK